MRNVVRTAGLLLAFATTASAQSINSAAIDRIFAAYTQPNTPGCVLGIGLDGELLFQRGYGMANLEYDVPLSAESIQEIGSVSKQFTTAAILLLARQGKLSLEDDIRKFLPEVPDFDAKITIRMLANHTSGLRDQWGLLSMLNSPPGSAVHTPEQILDLVTRQQDLNFPPNDQYLYSNTGYTLLGIIVKRVSGKSLAEFSRDHIFQPLGMHDTQWRDDFTRVVKGRATAYARRGDTYRQDMPFTNVYGNGGLLTTARDLITWWSALYNDRLGTGLLAELTTSGVLNDKHTIAYALGVSNETYRGVRTITHSGATAGYRAYLAAMPESRHTIAVLCSNASANSAAHARAVIDIVLADKLAPVTAPSAQKSADDIDLTVFAGLYRNPATEEIVRLDVRDNKLVGGPLELIALDAKTLYETRAQDRIEVVRSGPDITLRRPRADAPRTYVKVAEAKRTTAQLQEYAGSYRSPELDLVLTVAAQDGQLIIKRRLQNDLALSPSFADAFSNFGSWIFTRDAQGKVNGMHYSQGRIRRLRFVKTD